MQLALLPGWKWSLEKSLVFMGHLKKECPIPDRRLCNGQHFSRNQLLHDKSVGDILGICSSSPLFKGSQKKNISLPEEIWGWPFRNLLVPESGFQRLIPYNSTVFRVNVHCHLSLSYAFNMGFNGGIIWNYGKVQCLSCFFGGPWAEAAVLKGTSWGAWWWIYQSHRSYRYITCH